MCDYLVAMATMATIYMVNFVNKLKTSEEKRHYTSNLVCKCMSTTPLFKTAILHNIPLICVVVMITIYRVNFMGTIMGNVSHSPISTILTIEGRIWYVCSGLHLISSKMSLYLIFS